MFLHMQERELVTCSGKLSAAEEQLANALAAHQQVAQAQEAAYVALRRSQAQLGHRVRFATLVPMPRRVA
jgi:hypothetical protein